MDLNAVEEGVFTRDNTGEHKAVNKGGLSAEAGGSDSVCEGGEEQEEEQEMKLTEHFELEEFIDEKDLKKLEGGKDFYIKENLYRLACVLEKLRVEGNPIVITSGYRNEWKNRKVGGAQNSLHLYGMACDFVATRLNLERLVELVKNNEIGEFIVYTKKQDFRYLRFHISLPCFTLNKFGVILKAEEGVKNYEKVSIEDVVRGLRIRWGIRNEGV